MRSASLPIVAEDLGVITSEVEALRDRHQIPGMHVLQFDVTDDEIDLRDIEENSVCYTGTHDNDTTIGWFRRQPRRQPHAGQQIEAAQRAALAVTGGEPETIHVDMIKGRVWHRRPYRRSAIAGLPRPGLGSPHSTRPGPPATTGAGAFLTRN